jgi:hypothetical protein
MAVVAHDARTKGGVRSELCQVWAEAVECSHVGWYPVILFHTVIESVFQVGRGGSWAVT